MNLSQLGYRYSRVFLAITLVLMGVGFASYFTLPAQEDPSILLREAVITTEYPGMPANRVELLITKTLEEAIRKLPQVEEIQSVSMIGKSVIHVLIQDRFFNLSQIWDELRNEIEQATPSLPQGTQQPFINDDFDDVAILTVALLADEGFSMGEQYDMAQHARDMMFTVNGTKKVELFGFQEERIFIEIANTKFSQLGIAPEELISILEEQNIIRPGGTVEVPGKSFGIQPTGNFETLDDLRNVLIAVPNQETTIALNDIAVITRSVIDPPNQTAYYNGQSAIVFAIYQSDRSNVLEFSPRMESMIDKLNQDMPAGYRLEIITRQADKVAVAVYGVTESVLQTLGIVVVVVVMFLGIRTGIIVGSIIPAAILITLAMLSFNGMALERMSLATIIISLGLLVDNAIVVAEDFKKRLEEGESRDQALQTIGKTLSIPLLTSSVTTILVFMPLMLAEHDSGEYTRSISLVIFFSLAISWLLSLMITPFLCHKFIKIDSEKGIQAKISGLFQKCNVIYRFILKKILIFRFSFLMLMLFSLVAAGVGMSLVPVRFFPDSDRAQVLIYLDLPASSSMRETEKAIHKVNQQLNDKKRYPQIRSFATYGGFGGPRFVLSLNPMDPESSKGFVMLNVDKLENIDPLMTQLREMFYHEFPSLSARVTRMFLGPTDSAKIEIQIKGPDKDYIYAKAYEIEEILHQVPGSIDIRHNWENRVTQIKIEINQQKAKRAGISSSDVATSLEAYFSGTVITEFREGDEIFPVVLRATGEERFDLAQVQAVNIYSRSRKQSFPLMQIAEIKLENKFARIARENLFRTVTIEAKNTLVTAEDIVPIIEPQINKLRETLPAAYTIEYDGVIADSLESQKALNANLPLCFALIIVLLIAQFNSYRRAAIILLTIPFVIIGAAIGLLVMKADLGFMVVLGLYALAGIIVNNAIVLIDRIDNDTPAEGPNLEVIIQACVRRLRPILISTTTTIFGVLPLIVKHDPLFFSMAVTIAFGLAVGTIMTLGVVPVLFSLLFRVKSKG